MENWIILNPSEKTSTALNSLIRSRNRLNKSIPNFVDVADVCRKNMLKQGGKKTKKPKKKEEDEEEE